LAFAYPDRVARQRDVGGVRYVLASGRGARLPPHEHRLRPPWLVAASLDAGDTEGVVYLAAPVDIETVRRDLPAQFCVDEIIQWDSKLQRVIARREERLGELLIDSGPLANADPEQLRLAMVAGLQDLGIAALPWTSEVREWQARVLSLRHWFPQDGWPDVSDAALRDTFDEWLGPYLRGVTRREHLLRIDLIAAIGSRLDWKQRQRLEEGAPAYLTVPSGTRVRLEYKPGESPVLAVKLQEMFGLADTPRVAWGRVPITLHLLSPARRPIQVTQDLRGFWERTYAEVKKELKGRYPKHPWPDDPWKAAPTARTKRRGAT
jgi:ATP-dependent helicase HrpB